MRLCSGHDPNFRAVRIFVVAAINDVDNALCRLLLHLVADAHCAGSFIVSDPGSHQLLGNSVDLQRSHLIYISRSQRRASLATSALLLGIERVLKSEVRLSSPSISFSTNMYALLCSYWYYLKSNSDSTPSPTNISLKSRRGRALHTKPLIEGLLHASTPALSIAASSYSSRASTALFDLERVLDLPTAFSSACNRAPHFLHARSAALG